MKLPIGTKITINFTLASKIQCHYALDPAAVFTLEFKGTDYLVFRDGQRGEPWLFDYRWPKEIHAFNTGITLV